MHDLETIKKMNEKAVSEYQKKHKRQLQKTLKDVIKEEREKYEVDDGNSKS